MTDEMSIEDYLAQGGVLSSPANVPARYRGELLRLMATFVDSELAGAAGFADVINAAPGIRERIAAARIVYEKTAHADRVLRLMGEFGADTERYAGSHPWAARLPREADIGATRSAHDMRLAVFNYPLEGWLDSVVMNLLMGRAVVVQLSELTRVSYQPLADALREIAPTEARHAALAEEGLRKILADGSVTDEAQALVDYWWPRVAVSFGKISSRRAETLKEMGLRHSSNAELRRQWEQETAALLRALGLRPGPLSTD